MYFIICFTFCVHIVRALSCSSHLTMPRCTGTEIALALPTQYSPSNCVAMDGVLGMRWWKWGDNRHSFLVISADDRFIMGQLEWRTIFGFEISKMQLVEGNHSLLEINDRSTWTARTHQVHEPPLLICTSAQHHQIKIWALMGRFMPLHQSSKLTPNL